MEVISVKGESYIKGSIIARELGYTADYVGQLCRSGQIKATLVGRSWYVSEKSIRAHKKNRYRSNQAKSFFEVRKTVSELNRQDSAPLYSEKFAQAIYKPDDDPLLPPVNKTNSNGLSEDAGSVELVEKEYIKESPPYLETESVVHLRKLEPSHKPVRTDTSAIAMTRRTVAPITAAANVVNEYTRPNKTLRHETPIAGTEIFEVRSGLVFSSAIIAAGIFFFVVLIGLEQRSFVSRVLPPDTYYHFDLSRGFEASAQLFKN